jgi:phenylalanyl-tRNA synthetase alpha chain
MDKKLIESLSPNERKILPHIEGNIKEIIEKSGLDRVSVLRALEYLQNKEILKLSTTTKEIIELGVNGALYKKKGLPERRLLHILGEKKIIHLKDAPKESGLSQDEFKASLGALKKKALIELNNGKIALSANKEEISKKSLEEMFIESLPREIDTLAPEEKLALNSLKQRKEILQIVEKKKIEIQVTELGKELSQQKDLGEELIEAITPELIKIGKWKGKKFRRYDVSSPVPSINGGKRHFVNQGKDYARKIWSEMGFKEMTGDLTQSSFWVFDSLFTPQDHPARELQDTFFIDKKINLPDKKIVEDVKKCHEKGIAGSKGWRYNWDPEEAKKAVLRTHTTCLSAKTLAQLRGAKDKNGKFFAIGKCFRNETIDAGHLFEFNQTEGIVVDKDANFKNLLGYLKAFLNKMGFEKVRFRPHFFPYTEPSVEADIYDEKTGKWTEILGAGILRPEVVVPLLGEYVPVLAWGMGFDRLVMGNNKIKDIRELYSNDLTKLRKMKWLM